jgi:hypothetical protein
MPNWCENTLQVSGFENKEATQAFFEQHKGEEDLSFEKAVPYPAGSGWNRKWCRENWGTTWDADGPEGEVGEYDLTYNFATAWSPPLRWLKAIAAQHPDLTFVLRYEESGWGFTGLAMARGKLLRDECFWLYPWKSDEELLLLATLKNLAMLASLERHDSKALDFIEKAGSLLTEAGEELRKESIAKRQAESSTTA